MSEDCLFLNIWTPSKLLRPPPPPPPGQQHQETGPTHHHHEVSSQRRDRLRLCGPADAVQVLLGELHFHICISPTLRSTIVLVLMMAAIA